MAESWTERARRLERERTGKRVSRRAFRRKLRRMSAPARRRLKRELRKRKYRVQKRMFGACPTCSRAAGPGHVCRMKFGEHNAARLRARMERRGAEEYPNLWRGRQAA